MERRTEVTPPYGRAGNVAGVERVRRLIASVDWSGVSHAYGPAVDTPHQLRRLLDDHDRIDAFEQLNGSIWHQSTVYPATVAAAPILAEIACSHRGLALHPLMLLVLCAEADDRRADARAATREAISEHLERLVDVTIADGEGEHTYLWPLTAALAALLPATPLAAENYAEFEDLLRGDEAEVFLSIRSIAAGRDHPDEVALGPISELSSLRTRCDDESSTPIGYALCVDASTHSAY
jgi:hypothetical protein